jgi:beta-lactamase superfamily II metal-dependent hydrolase
MGISYEVEFIHVGTGQRNGDAIVVRYGQPGDYRILVYDGGTLESGQKLVDHIKQNYGTTRVHDVVNSHPDADHASGLRVVLEELRVDRVHMHRPWEHSAKILGYFKDGRITDASLAARLKEKMAAAYELEQMALKKGILAPEPFLGDSIGGFVVLSPERSWYIHDLIAGFEKSPAPKSWAEAAIDTVVKTADTLVAEALAWVDEKWDLETLAENVETSAENESSVVLVSSGFEGGDILFTGDAGVQALSRVADYAEDRSVSLPNRLGFVQIPHHGSRHNVCPSVLDRIIGPRMAAETPATKTAFVSACKDCTTHPRKVVTNAFQRRGYSCYRHSNAGWIRYTRGNMPARNTTPITAIPFHSRVEG